VGDVDLVIVADDNDPGCASVMVDGTVDGRSYRCLLDTGTGRTHIVADDFISEFAPLRQIASSGVFAPSNDVLIQLPDVTVGALSRRPCEVVRLDVGQPGARNLLGMDLMKTHRCDFLFDDGRLVIDSPGQLETSHDLHLDDADHPYVGVRFPELTAQAVWDTGAGITIVDRGFLATHPESFHEFGSSTGTDATGAQVETPTFVVSEMTIGGVRFSPHRVAAVDLAPANATLARPMDLILGFTTLVQANWHFDFSRQAVGVTRGFDR